MVKSPTGGAADPALTAHGVQQARELGDRLVAADPPIERAYSSLYYRCLQTAEPFVRNASQTVPAAVGQATDAATTTPGALRIRGETGIGEWYGAANFEHPVPATPEMLSAFFPGLLDPDYTPAVVPTRMGEGVDELHDRVARTMEALVAECDRDGVRAVLLCSHAAVVIALGRVLTGNMPENIEVEDFRAFTCGLSLYRRRKTADLVGDGGKTSTAAEIFPRRHTNGAGETAVLEWRGGRGVAGGWDCELNSDCSHLSGGEERGWRFSGDESFKDAASQPDILLDAGVELGVVVEGKAKAGGDGGNTAGGGSRL